MGQGAAGKARGRRGWVPLVLLLAGAACNFQRGDESPTPAVVEVTEAVTNAVTASPTSPAALVPTPGGAATLPPTPSGIPTMPLGPTPGPAGVIVLPTVSLGGGLPPTPGSGDPGFFQLESSFDAPEAGWIAQSEEGIARGYENGAYSMAITSAEGTRWGYTLGPASTTVPRDVVIEVDARLSESTGDAAYGLVCRQSADQKYYFLAINTAGQVQIGKMDNNNRIPLVDWTPAPGLHPATEFNRLRAGCVGNVLWIEANGALLARVEDNSYSGGAFGFFALTNRAGTVRVDYDNLRIVGR